MWWNRYSNSTRLPKKFSSVNKFYRATMSSFRIHTTQTLFKVCFVADQFTTSHLKTHIYTWKMLFNYSGPAVFLHRMQELHFDVGEDLHCYLNRRTIKLCKHGHLRKRERFMMLEFEKKKIKGKGNLFFIMKYFTCLPASYSSLIII